MSDTTIDGDGRLILRIQASLVGCPAVSVNPSVEIKVRDHGPYKVTGPVRLIDAEGNAWETGEGETIVLCRCGWSQTKPFCDKSHRREGFESCERATD
jgi:CDGSH iron-sulfur domain-containing protein 3